MFRKTANRALECALQTRRDCPLVPNEMHIR